MPEIYTVMYVNYFSVKVGEKCSPNCINFRPYKPWIPLYKGKMMSSV